MRMPLRLCVAVGAMAITMAALATTAYAAPPANDNFASPQAISALAPYAGTNVDSTTESSTDPTEAQRLQSLSGWGIFNTTWHEWEAPSAGEVTFVVCSAFATNVLITSGSSVDTVSLATPSIGSALQQGTSQAGPADPSGCEQGQYHAVLGSFAVASGTVLRPVIGSAFNGSTGSYTITTTFTLPPDNDDFANRFDLFSRHTQSGSNLAASTQVDEASNPYANFRTVWYQFEAPGTATVDFTLCSTFAANLVVYSGSSLPLTPLQFAQGSTVDTCGAGKYLTQISGLNTTAGQVLKVQVGGYNGNEYTGTFDITASYNGVPPNDEWDDAIDLGNSDLLVVYGDNTNATPGLPTISGESPQGSVWYKWTAPASRNVEIDTCAGAPSNYNGYLAVFSADPAPPTQPADLSQFTAEDDSCPGDRPLMPKLSFSASEGETYWIAFSLTTSNPNPLFSEFTLQISSPEPDNDGDGYPDSVDDCPFNSNESPKTNGCPIEQISVTSDPTISGASSVGAQQSITNLGSAQNIPGADSSVAAPIVDSVNWWSCSSGTNVGTCQARSGSGSGINSVYTAAAGDVGRFIRVEVIWDNGEGDQQSGWSAAGSAVAQPTTPPSNPPSNPPSAPPVTPTDPLSLVIKPALGTVKRDKKGVATLKGAVVTCGAAATSACTGTAAISAKVGKKTVRFGNAKISAAAGTSGPVKFKPSSKLAKAIKRAKGKKLKVTFVFSVSAPGFAAQKATATAVLK